jgi:hypothetical protein
MTVAARRPLRNRSDLNLTFSENAGTGERLDMLGGHFVIAPPHDRLLRSYLPPRPRSDARDWHLPLPTVTRRGLLSMLLVLLMPCHLIMAAIRPSC